MRIDREFSLNLIKAAIKAGASQAEVYQRATRNLSAEAKSGNVEAVETSFTMGYGLRVIKNGRPGFSYSTDPGESDSVVDIAIETSRYSAPDENIDFPEPVESLSDPLVYDSEIASIKEKDAIERALVMESSAFGADGRVKKSRNAEASFSEGETLIENSKGLSRLFRTTFCSAHIMAVAEEGGESRMGWDYRGGRFLSGVPFDKVGIGAARRATCMLGARRATPVKGHVILESPVAAEFLSVFSSMLSSESVQKGKSLLRGRKGDKVISAMVDVIDDGLLEGGPGTRPVDDEGVPTGKKILIRKGVLEGYMYNTYTAKKDGVRSTGNAVRGGPFTPPSVGPTNLYIGADKTESKENMLNSIKKGIYVIEAMGMHTANPISGDFSIGVSGLWVDEGKIIHPVKEAVISGNLLDFFDRIEAVGEDVMFLGGIGSPSLLFSDTDISS